tara:strand:+ start:2110 stop:4083 length:1974 start_codon:yes stop_codon:yes gene_type:complete
MGGVAGSMSHLYDNPSLTFSKMKEILTAASNAELDAEEKTDGQNLFLSYSVKNGKAVGARNKGNLRKGGLDAPELATKFADRGNLTDAFVGGFDAFERAVESLPEEEKLQIFGDDADIWYNAEIMDPDNANVILYDSKLLKIHDRGHFKFDKQSGERSDEDVSRNLAVLDNNLQRMQSQLSDQKFSLVRSAVIQLNKLDDDIALNKAINDLNSVVSAEGLGDDANVGQYVYKRIVGGIDDTFPEGIRHEITRYLLKLPGNIGLRQLKKQAGKQKLEDLNDVVSSKNILLKQAIQPIENIIHDFAVEILKGIQSVFIVDTDKEVARQREELANAVNQVTEIGPENPKAMEVLQANLNKIKDMKNLSTPIEGIVFDYDGHTYKFTGNFAPLNQILGLFKYGTGTKKLTKESVNRSQVLTEVEGKRIALIPGGFKPPHAGHFQLAKHFSDKDDIDEVIIVVSRKARPPVNVDMSVALWDLYTKDFPKISVRAGTTPSPVGDVYELIANNQVFKEGDVALLGKSEKDEGDQRFDRAQSYAERNNPGVKVESVITPLFAGGVSGTQMRQFLSLGEEGKKDFQKNLPKHLSQEEKEEAYKIVASPNENLYNFIDSTIDEMSTMAGGAVEIGVGPFGSGKPNKYNPYKKPKKPKVRRPKRQRRR